MPEFNVSSILQIVVALGLLNVWLVRSGTATEYRGGDARSLKAEFAAYGLPDIAFYIVGLLKVGSAVALIAGLWMPELVAPAAGVVAVLMVGALAMHVKVKDPAKKSVPALLMLAMCVAILGL
ncbi:MAG: DoxX family protein [Rhodothermales bacterium]